MLPRRIRYRRELHSPTLVPGHTHAERRARAAQQYQGFFPSVPHGKLPEPFDVWESHLAAANARLILGAVEDGDFAEMQVTRQWRRVIDNVRQFVP